MSDPQPPSGSPSVAVKVVVPGPRAVTIESDGTPQGTLITDTATGELIPMVQRIELVIDVHELTRLTITQVRVPVTVTMPATFKEVSPTGLPLDVATMGRFGALELTD